jgi:hypothetical protein
MPTRAIALHLDAVGGSVDDLVYHGVRAAEMLFERRDVSIQAAEKEAR